MKRKPIKLPKSKSNRVIGRAVKRLDQMPMADKIQLLVEAKLMSQEEADQAKSKLETAQ